MTTLYLIRHGETAWNADGRFQGQQDIPLNATGREQAAGVARALEKHHFDALYTSDLVRASETAEVIGARLHLTPVPDARLRENFFGDWEGHDMPEIGERWPETLAAWRADIANTRPPNGDTLQELQARVASFFVEIVTRHPDATVAIVAHGGSLRAIIAEVLAADMSIFRRVRLDNCSISIVRANPGNYTLLHMNDICHFAHQTPRSTWDESGDQWRLALGEE